MDALARQLAEKDAAASATLTDAVDLARRLTIGTNMHETSRDLGENRVGVALAPRNANRRRPAARARPVAQPERRTRPTNWSIKLRQAQERLAGAARSGGQLREQIQRAEQQGAAADRSHIATLSISDRPSSADRSSNSPASSIACRPTPPAAAPRARRAGSTTSLRGGNQNAAAKQQPSSSEPGPAGRKGSRRSRPPIGPAHSGSRTRSGPRIRPPLPGRAAGDDHATKVGHRRHRHSRQRT